MNKRIEKVIGFVQKSDWYKKDDLASDLEQMSHQSKVDQIKNAAGLLAWPIVIHQAADVSDLQDFFEGEDIADLRIANLKSSLKTQIDWLIDAEETLTGHEAESLCRWYYTVCAALDQYDFSRFDFNCDSYAARWFIDTIFQR